MNRYFSGKDATINYSELNPASFKTSMQTYGCCLIKGLFQAEEIDTIKNETLDLFYIIKNLQHNNLINEQNEKYLMGGHPANILPSLDSLESVLNKSQFIQVLREYFNKEEFVINTESTGIRRCDPREWKNYLPWHQDIFHRGDSFITCWLPLMNIDNRTPGLDLVPKKMFTKIAEQDGMDVAYNGKGLEDPAIDAKATYLRWRPEMTVGDVLIFDPYCPHRTSYSEDFTVERYSIDIRIHPKDCVPDKTWTSQIINLPSMKSPPASKLDRSLFQLRHLVSLDLPARQSQEKMENSGFLKIKRRIKSIFAYAVKSSLS